MRKNNNNNYLKILEDSKAVKSLRTKISEIKRSPKRESNI